MAARLIAGAMTLVDIVLAAGIALYVAREIRRMCAPAQRVWRGRWTSYRGESGTWQSARVPH